MIRPMTVADLPAVMRIEQAVFTDAWKEEYFEHDLTQNTAARYCVLEENGTVLGYAAIWLELDEAHCINLAVDESARGRGLGEELLRHCIQLAADCGCMWMSLECRRSNTVAQSLYHKAGFVDVGYRKRYYPNGEDALVMALLSLPEGNPENDPMLVVEEESDASDTAGCEDTL